MLALFLSANLYRNNIVRDEMQIRIKTIKINKDLGSDFENSIPIQIIV